MIKKKWQRPLGDPSQDSLVDKILKNRGFSAQEAEKFLNVSYQDLLDPFLFTDMEKSVGRIWKAIENAEAIAVYADYDADAVTAASVVLRVLEYLGANTIYYIPDRFKEGYGLNIEAFEQLKSRGASLIITVDCGTNSVDVADWCLENKIDLIITDHHEVTGGLPGAFTLLNPKNPAEAYPDKQLTGVGVTFKLAQGLFADDKRVTERRTLLGQTHAQGWEKWLLDLTCIGTIADCHSLLGENRIIVKFGLKVLAKSKWVGLKKLLNNLQPGPKKTIDPKVVGWKIAPRINAAGRLEHAGLALDLLLTNDETEAQRLADGLERINLRRQGITERIISEATEQALIQQDRDVLVLAGMDWHTGVVGVVAGRMAEKFGKPSFVLGGSGNFFTGSARSRNGFNTVECLKFSSVHLTRFGGHAGAAGLTLEKTTLEAFTLSVLEFAKSKTEASPDEPEVLEIDAILETNDLNVQTCKNLEQMEPFGMGNPEPQLLLAGATVSNTKPVGKDQSHIRIMLDFEGMQIDAIAFSKAREFAWMKPGDKLDLAVTMSINEWNGRESISLKIIDAAPA